MKDYEVLINNFKNSIFNYKYVSNKYIKATKLNDIQNLHYKILQKLNIYKEENILNSKKIIKIVNRLIIFTLYSRDKYYGIGSLDLFKIQFYNYIVFEKLIHKRNLFLLLTSVLDRKKNEENIGCWKDLKYLSTYLVYEKNIKKDSYIMNMIYEIYSDQIKEDCNTFDSFKKISWCGKWIPREKSAYGWMVPFIMSKLFDIKNIKLSPQYYNYLKQYRQIVSNLNIILNTSEIHLCNNTWSRIDFNNKSQLFFKKYYNNFKNVKSKYASDDRKNCIKKFKDFNKISQDYKYNKETYLEVYLFPNYKNMKLSKIVNVLKDNSRYNYKFINYKF
ncbi:hypothetical protein CL656_04685 [bacterium]|nr:hypothetical protein [bacterium]|tara:strand:- start:5827 stop:6822 length:996 start_codon:yes stop_codon:yes gene_type:complete